MFMEYLVIQASSNAPHNPEAPSFVLLPLKNKMLSVFDDLQEMAEEANESDSSILGIRRWLPVVSYWIGYEEQVAEAVQEAKEASTWNWPTLELTGEEIEDMDVKSIDSKTIQMQPSQDFRTKALLKGRQGSIRIRSYPFTESDLKGESKSHI
jgi:hypothetical protein